MKYVAYFRVSTRRQGASGLGLEAQEAAVDGYVAGRGEVIGRFTEIESGRRNDRSQLNEAIALCKRDDAVLVIARLDRLSRNVLFTAQLLDAGVRFVACDNPGANETTILIMATLAQAEAKTTAERTRAALAAAKARGVKLGAHNARTALALSAGRSRAIESRAAKADAWAQRNIRLVRGLQKSGLTTLEAVAGELNAMRVPARRGGKWYAKTVANLIRRVEAAG